MQLPIRSRRRKRQMQSRRRDPSAAWQPSACAIASNTESADSQPDGKPIGQHRTGCAGFRGEFLQSPGVGRPIVQQGQRPADQRIPQPREPARIVVRKLPHVQTNNLDEHQFRKPVEDALAARPFVAHFGRGEADELVEQII
jgi:hypothetical protein